ncbi:MAG: GIY-YIG nuclease family protein [candidate division KSB1 bacterium]|nr:GIY-YIG nuclease family protein [candidate division KSB1 bacterium]
MNKLPRPEDAVTYQLWMIVEKNITVTVGKLGNWGFPAGCYVYTGSARRGLESRIERHRKKVKPLRWHIDYLTVLPEVSIIQVCTFYEQECVVNQKVEGEIICPGFGAGDCSSGCVSHLKRVNSFT